MGINSPVRALAPSRAGARQRSNECAEPPRHARCDGGESPGDPGQVTAQRKAHGGHSGLPDTVSTTQVPAQTSQAPHNHKDMSPPHLGNRKIESTRGKEENPPSWEERRKPG
jgi:hypothetical protein